MAEAATLSVSITENIYLNGNYRNSGVEYTVPSIIGVDNRIVNIPSGSVTELLKFTGSLAGASAGTVISDSLAYLRVTNLEDLGNVYIKFTGAISGSYTVELDSKESFILNNTYLSGSTEELRSLSVSVGTIASGSKNIEYYLATT